MCSHLRLSHRSRADADVAACIILLRAVHEADGYPQVWPPNPVAFLNPEGLLQAWIALHGDAVVGHVVLGTPENRRDQGEVKRLFVDPVLRRKGVARGLLDVAVAHAQALQILPVLEVTTDGTEAIRLYESAGWRRSGTKRASWSDASGAHPLLYTYELR